MSGWCEELFSACRTEFKHLEYFYFHNCIYEGVWKDNRRRWTERIDTFDIIHRFGADHKLVIVGDAAMSPYEVTHPGGTIEHMNEEAGAVWMKRLTDTYASAAWINPTPEPYWGHSASTAILRKLMDDRMFPLSLQGLEAAMRTLSRKKVRRSVKPLAARSVLPMPARPGGCGHRDRRRSPHGHRPRRAAPGPPLITSMASLLNSYS